jgi:hypothetical protein
VTEGGYGIGYVVMELRVGVIFRELILVLWVPDVQDLLSDLTKVHDTVLPCNVPNVLTRSKVSKDGWDKVGAIRANQESRADVLRHAADRRLFFFLDLGWAGSLRRRRALLRPV